MSRKKTKKKSDDFGINLDGDDVAIDFGPIKIRGNKGPTAEENKLREHIMSLQQYLGKMKLMYISLRETAIRQQERLNTYRQIMRVLLPKLDSLKDVPDGEKKEAIEKIQNWIKDLTKDDNLEG